MPSSRQTRYKRVCEALPKHYERLRKMRGLRAELLAKDAGARFPGHDGLVYGEVINLIQQARLAMEISLAANCPKFQASTHSPVPAARAFASKIGRMLDSYAQRIGMKQSLQACVGEAFISLGIGKVYEADGEPFALDVDNYVIPGKPYFASRTIDHFVWDQSATDYRYASFFADRYRAPFEVLVEDKRVPKRIRDALAKSGSDGIDQAAEGEVKFLQKLDSGGGEDVVPWTYLADVYLPDSRIIQTYAVGENFRSKLDEPLFEYEWDGAPLGPYHFLNLGQVPSTTIPSSPAQNCLALANFSNTLWRKIRDDAERQKEVTIGQSGHEDDNETVRNSKSGDHLCLDHPDAIKTLKLSGPDQQLYSLLHTAIAMFDRAGGNVQFRLGAGASGSSGKHESIIGDQVSRLEGHFQSAYADFVRNIGRELGAMLYRDPVTVVPMSLKVKGTEILVSDDWLGAFDDGAREGSFDIYSIDIVPYTGAYRPPREKLRDINEAIANLQALEPHFNAQGKALDPEHILKLTQDLADLPELDGLFKDIEPTPQTVASARSAPSDKTYTHTYVNDSAPPDPLLQLSQAGN